MRRSKVVQGRVNAAEKELIRMAARLSGFESESELVRRLAIGYALNVLEELDDQGARAEVDVDGVLASFRATREEVSA